MVVIKALLPWLQWRKFLPTCDSWHTLVVLNSGRTNKTDNVTLRCVRVAIVAVEKQWVLCILIVCVCSLSYTTCKAHALYRIVCDLSSSPIFFHIFSYKRHDFREESYWTCYKMCYDFLYNFRRKHFSFCEEFSKILLQMYIGLYVQFPLFLSDFNQTRIFSTESCQISWKFIQWQPSHSMQTDGQTDITKPIVPFHSFLNTSNNVAVLLLHLLFYASCNTNKCAIL